MKTLLTPCKGAVPLLAALLAFGSPAAASSDAWAGRLLDLERETAVLRQHVQQQEQVLQRLGRPTLPSPSAAGAAGLAALLLGGGAAWFLRQRRRLAVPAFEPDIGSEPQLSANEPPASDATAASGVPDAMATGAGQHPSNDAPAPSVLRVEVLYSLQQQADFFISLGQPEEAARLYEEFVQQTDEPPAAALLELLQLYERLGDAGGYAGVAQEFQRRFGALPPSEEPEAGERAGLEEHASLLADLQALWPQPQVLAEIEFLIGSGCGAAGPLSLAASRELMWLHAIAQDLLQPQDDGMNAVDAADTWMERIDAFDVAPRAGVAVDVDLDALVHAQEQTDAVRLKAQAPKQADALEWDADLFDAATGFERHTRSAPLVGTGR